MIADGGGADADPHGGGVDAVADGGDADADAGGADADADGGGDKTEHSVAALFCTLPSNLEIFDNLQVGLQKPKGRLYFKYKIANLDGKIYHIVKLQTIIILFNFKLDIM